MSSKVLAYTPLIKPRIENNVEVIKIENNVEMNKTIKNGQKWPKMTENDRKWSKRTENDQKWSKKDLKRTNMVSRRYINGSGRP